MHRQVYKSAENDLKLVHKVNEIWTEAIGMQKKVLIAVKLTTAK